MTKTFTIEKGQKPTAEMMREVEEAKRHPITFDEDCPELSPAMLKAFKSAVVQRNRKKKCINTKLKSGLRKTDRFWDKWH